MTLVVLVTCAVVLAMLISALPDRRQVRQGIDYEAMADIESHDVDDMLDAIAERRARTGRRDVGEELGDELMRGGWD
jgi:hypothetical protein